MQPLYFHVIEQICAEKNYQFKNLDTFSGILGEIRHGDKSILIGDSQYPLNSHTAVMTSTDKALMYLALENAAVKIPHGNYFFISPHARDKRADGKELMDAIHYANDRGYPQFVKPINSYSGDFATVINSEAELLPHLQKTSEKYHAVIIQEPIFQQEHRLFIMDGKAWFSYDKKRAELIGDGESTIEQLLETFLDQRKQQYKDNSYRLNQRFINETLTKKNLSYDSVLAADKVLSISPNANPNCGGFINNFTTTIPPECTEWGVKIAKIIGLRICAIDFFTHDTINDNPEDFLVIEVNGNPSLKMVWSLGYQLLVKAIWQYIVKTCLKEA
ncbi:MAG: hypothetical protein GQ569_06670 [Methylococcaceae bacterium]|nr:hypothetical protein [Methylococcaceae bacterium]